MRIVACPSDRQAVGTYRLGMPAAALMEQDESIHFHFLPGLPLNVSHLTGQPVGLAQQFYDLEPDILILQRPMADWKPLAMRDAQKHGIRVIVEIDDDFHALHHAQKIQLGLTSQHLRNLGECVKHADLITASTDALAKRYGGHGRVVVLRNCVDERWTEIDHCSDDPYCGCFEGHDVVGWTGTVASHRDDLQATHGGVAMAIDEHNARFRVIGRPELAQQNLGLTTEPEHTPWQSMVDYPHEIAKLDVGIAPLADNAFNRSKSFLKPLEMAACGVPCVMSPTVEYKRLHDQHGIGILAGWRSREWKREVGRLLTDHALRAEMAEHGRQQVREHHTIQGNAHRWAECWEATLSRKPVHA